MGLAHEWLVALAAVAVPVIELMALILISAGTIEAFVRSVKALLIISPNSLLFRQIWLRYARWLIGGLTFQLAADIIATSTAPTWDEIGHLAAIAVIRTFLNFFLERDQRELQEVQPEAAS